MFVRQTLSITVVLSLVAFSVAADALPEGLHQRVPVGQPTRLDWVFALSNQSPTRPPAEWLKDYDSTRQAYQLAVPPRLSDRPLPLGLFISPSDRPTGQAQWQATCRRHGVLFASPHGAGNGCPFPRRVRIILDVLDDLRRRYSIDANRTYLAGFSGGGRVACAIGFALPEYFGGVVPVCAAGSLRPESWLRHRVIDRLSVALVTGETDFNRSEIERFRGPQLKEVGVRARTWMQPGSGHTIPIPPLEEVFGWLEKDQSRRVALARSYPASRLSEDSTPRREEWARALLAEGKKRLQTPDKVYSGLMQLKGVMVRWNDLPAAAEAKQILLQYEGRTQRPWEQEDIAEQRRFLVAQARGIDAYGSGPLPSQYARQRPDMLKAALRLWERVLQDGQDKQATRQAQERIPILRKRLADEGKSDDDS